MVRKTTPHNKTYCKCAQIVKRNTHTYIHSVCVYDKIFFNIKLTLRKLSFQG